MERLRNLLKSIEGKGYKAYKDISGTYETNFYKLEILNVQGDPFASPTMFELECNLRKFFENSELYNQKYKRVAFEDFLLREIYEGLEEKQLLNEVFITKPQEELIKRSVISVKGDKLFIKYYLNLPAKGRNVLGEEAFDKIYFFSEEIYNVVKKFNFEKAKKHIKLNESIELFRETLKKEKIKVFIANGTILKKGEKEFMSPPSLEKEFILNDGRIVAGMCLKEGITIITGYDFHGKSTLLESISLGIYNHIEGSGKEFLLTDKEAINIFTEKGRVINGLDMSAFISGNEDLKKYKDNSASSLISQIANLVEAIEVGKPLLLIDEDDSVANFLYRDENLKYFFEGDEKISPYYMKMKSIYDNLGVSSIIVTSSIGSFLNSAHQVLMLKDFKVFDISNKFPYKNSDEVSKEKILINRRKLDINSNFEDFQSKKIKLKTCGLRSISFGKEEINLNPNILMVQNGQLNYIGELIKKIFSRTDLQEKTLREVLDIYEERIESEGIEDVLGIKNGSLIFARKYEVASVINRFWKNLYI